MVRMEEVVENLSKNLTNLTFYELSLIKGLNFALTLLCRNSCDVFSDAV
jgi:hypothetical protein